MLYCCPGRRRRRAARAAAAAAPTTLGVFAPTKDWARLSCYVIRIRECVSTHSKRFADVVAVVAIAVVATESY
jgi:hypothetical protein